MEPKTKIIVAVAVVIVVGIIIWYLMKPAATTDKASTTKKVTNPALPAIYALAKTSRGYAQAQSGSLGAYGPGTGTFAQSDWDTLGAAIVGNVGLDGNQATSNGDVFDTCIALCKAMNIEVSANNVQVFDDVLPRIANMGGFNIGQVSLGQFLQ